MKPSLIRSALLGLLLAAAPSLTLCPGWAAAYRPPIGAALFAGTNVPHFKIVIGSNELPRLSRGTRTYVPAEVWLDGRPLQRVGVRLKGNGSFQSMAAKPSLALKFDAHTPRQRLFGLSKVLLNNASQDSSLMSEYLAAALFHEAGVPAARVTHARVELNGRDLGFYVLTEAMNKDFLRQHFANPDGTLYEAYARDITGPLEQDGGSDVKQEDVRRLVTAAQLPHPDRIPHLTQVLDVDRFLSFLAITMLSSQHDSYALNRNNYRLYHDPTTGRFVMLPHGIDGSFSRPNLPLVPPRNYLLTQALLETEEQQRVYRERASALFTNVFTLEFMTNRVLQAVQNLQTAATGPAEREALRNRGHGFIRRIFQRHQGVARQLAGNESPVLAVTKDTPVGEAGWMQEDSGSGTAQFARVDLEGLKTLQIKTGAVSSVASWRKGVLLAPGAYKFQARVRVHNPSGNLRAGAALRISGVSGGRLLPQAAQWQTIEFPFNVRETAPDVVLICEVRGAEVEALFDIDSLRLSP